jgi:hypothetical protein
VKWLFVLAGAVFLLLLAWFLLGRSSSPQVPGHATVVFEIPSQIHEKPALIRAAQQFLSVDPKGYRVHEGCELLRVVAEGLGDEEWPQVQAAMFRGWSGLQAIPGSREDLAPVLEKLLGRFVRFGSVQDLGALIRKSNENVYWKSPVDQILLRAVSKEVPVPGFQESRLLPILEAAVGQKDYARASEYVTQARFAGGVPDAARAPVVRLEAALRLYYEAKGENPPMAAVIRDWASAPEDRLSGPLHLAAGIDLARAGQYKLEFGRLKQAMAASKSQERAGEYWERVLGAYLDLLPVTGSGMEAPALQALIGAYGELYPKKAFESQYWKKVANKSTAKTLAEGMWRVECLKHAFWSEPEDAQKVALLKEIGQGYRTWMPGAALKNVEALAGQIESGRIQPELAAIVEDAKKTDAEHQLRQKKVNQELALLPIKSQVEALKRQLAQTRKSGGTPELIQKLELQIKDLEKRLPE